MKAATRIDWIFHRFVLFFGHKFNAATRMFSEFELEHALAGEGKPGEVELEQAYIEHDFGDAFTGRAGVMLIPAGILNEVHEPPTFYGVERNNVEKNIIPSTWWEGGAGGTVTTAAGLQIGRDGAWRPQGADGQFQGAQRSAEGRQFGTRRSGRHDPHPLHRDTRS